MIIIRHTTLVDVAARFYKNTGIYHEFKHIQNVCFPLLAFVFVAFLRLLFHFFLLFHSFVVFILFCMFS